MKKPSSQEKGERGQQDQIGGNAQRERREPVAEAIEKCKQQSGSRTGGDQQRDSLVKGQAGCQQQPRESETDGVGKCAGTGGAVAIRSALGGLSVLN
jgi:hypothetical protein